MNNYLDIVFLSLDDLKSWVIGLQLLFPASHRQISPGKLAWMRAILKINHLGFEPFVTNKNKDWSSVVNAPMKL